MDNHPEPTPSLHLSIAPEWSFVDDLRRFVEAFCASTTPDEDAQVSLAAHELVQNAIANAEGPGIEVDLAVDPGARRVILAVTNVASRESAERLRARLARLYARPDALDAYLAAMDEDPHGRGGLGLARVRYEAGLDLDIQESAGRITVRAYTPAKVTPSNTSVGVRSGE
jgi:hypothetical protein